MMDTGDYDAGTDGEAALNGAGPDQTKSRAQHAAADRRCEHHLSICGCLGVLSGARGEVRAASGKRAGVRGAGLVAGGSDAGDPGGAVRAAGVFSTAGGVVLRAGGVSDAGAGGAGTAGRVSRGSGAAGAAPVCSGDDHAQCFCGGNAAFTGDGGGNARAAEPAERARIESRAGARADAAAQPRYVLEYDCGVACTVPAAAVPGG